MEQSDQFESQLKEILDSGPAGQPAVQKPAPQERDITVSASEKEHRKVFEVVLRIAGVLALIALLIGFALRISLF